jgi:hypothetical protein
VDATCSNADGGITISGLKEGLSYTLKARRDAASNPVDMGTVLADNAGRATYTGLEAGDYTDAFVEETVLEETNIIPAFSIKHTQTPTLGVAGLTTPSQCGGSNGSLTINVSGMQTGSAAVSYKQDGDEENFTANIVNGAFTINGLSAALYTEIRITTAAGCISNSVSASISDPGSPAIAIDEVRGHSTNERDPGVIYLNGLVSGENYEARLKPNSQLTFNQGILSESGTRFKITGRPGGSFGTLTLRSSFYTFYILDDNGCPSNTLATRVVQDDRPDGVGGVAGIQNDGLAMFEMYHRYLYRAQQGTVPNPGEHPYTGVETLSEYRDVIAGILIHEFGHVMGLDHTFDDGIDFEALGYTVCDDIQIADNCNQNNFMSNNCSPPRNAFSPCQVETIHASLSQGDWADNFTVCNDNTTVSNLYYVFDTNAGQLQVFNQASFSSPTLESFYTIRPQHLPGVEYYSESPVLGLSMLQFAGKSFEICANTLDQNGCLGIEDCETITFPVFDECFIPQTGGIQINYNKKNIPTDLFAATGGIKPFYWTFTSQNGSSLSGICKQDPKIEYSRLARFIGDQLDVCVSILGQVRGKVCTTQVCTTIVLPPTITYCKDRKKPVSFDLSYSLDRADQNSPYIVSVQSGYQKVPLGNRVEYQWIVEDRNTGELHFEWGGNTIDLKEGVHFERDEAIDIRVCNLVYDKIQGCVIGFSCEQIYEDCEFTHSFGQIKNLQVFPSNDNLFFGVEFPSNADNSTVSIDVYIDGEHRMDASYSFLFNTANVFVPLADPCGTVTVEIRVSYMTSSNSFCAYDKEAITYGPQPCITPGPPGLYPVAPTPAKRTGLSSQGYSLRVAPNPTGAGFSMLTLHTSDSENLSIHLHDMLGKVVKRYQAAVDKGDNRIRLDLQGLSAGVYLLQVHGSRQQSIKLIIE